jgi:hypothetical protein
MRAIMLSGMPYAMNCSCSVVNQRCPINNIHIGVRAVVEYQHSVYEYIFTNRDILERGDLSDDETEVLSGKVEHLAALLGE